TIIRVHGERNRNFAGGNHIHWAFVLIEDFEDLAQVAVSHQHAAGYHVDDTQLFLDRDRFERAFAMWGQRDDAGPLAGGIAAVEHQHGNVLLDGRQNGGRMQYLGAEVGQFGGFFKADHLHTERIRANARIGGHDAVHVRPDFDRLGG